MSMSYDIPVELKQLVSPNQAFHYRIVPQQINDNVLTLATDQQNIHSLSQELSILFDQKIQLTSISSDELQSYLAFNYRAAITEERKVLQDQSSFLKTLLQTAKEFGSSDIHIEPYEDVCRVRFRLDGKLKEQYQIPLTEFPQLINQIKIKAGLDISQKRLAQDGRITSTTEQEDYDIRVSTMPTLYGEKIVLRILQRDSQEINLEELGLKGVELQHYLQAIKQPNGIILISGPTGSGKTTTLYGTLKLLNQPDTNILTIEDPIEYTLHGINQVQVKEDIGFDFSKALRTFLRQDPDIIMVGEIRDEQTANMAVKAALTGHLVLSTIHTNSSWATISRLIDMGVPGYLLASTINLSIAQRLIRKLCVHCKKATAVIQDHEPSTIDIPNLKTHFTPTGCTHCYFTGFQGRIALYEVLPITRELRSAIKRNDLQIDDYLAQHKIKTLKAQALAYVKEGITSIEEVYALLID